MLVKEEKSSSTHFGISWVPEFFTMVTVVGLKWDKRGFKTNAVAIILLLHTYLHILCTNSSYCFWLLLVRWELEIPTKFCYIYERVVAVGKRYGFPHLEINT